MKKGPNRRPSRVQIAREEARTQRNSIGLPPLQRVKRAPGEVNPRRGKGGGLNRSRFMIEKGKAPRRRRKG